MRRLAPLVPPLRGIERHRKREQRGVCLAVTGDALRCADHDNSHAIVERCGKRMGTAQARQEQLIGRAVSSRPVQLPVRRMASD